MTADLHATTLEAARQAAREAVAREYEDAGSLVYAAEIRHGEHDDDNAAIKVALTGARAAHAAVIEAAARACADVAARIADEQRREAGGFRQDLRAAFQNRAMGAAFVERAIRALLEKDTPK